MSPETNHYHYKNNLCLSLYHLTGESAPVLNYKQAYMQHGIGVNSIIKEGVKWTGHWGGESLWTEPINMEGGDF